MAEGKSDTAADTGSDSASSIVKDSGTMAIATLVSRLTGFGWRVLLAAVLGFGVVQDSFYVATGFPFIIYELLLGNVLASAMIPVLVRAQTEDEDNGVRYAQRLVTMVTVALVTVTSVAMLCAPLLTDAYVDSSTGRSNPALVTAFTYLVLPAIILYGLTALFGAMLHTKRIFGPPAWAPVVNNVVMFTTLVLYAALPGEISLNPVRMGDAKLLVLGLGTTIGVTFQTLMLVPWLRRTGFRFRWRWGWDPRLSKFVGLMVWAVGYALASQVTVWVNTRLATAAAEGSLSIYNTVWMLVQVPYGVLGVSLLTAIMPRMSQAAAAGDHKRVIEYLSQGSRLSAVLLVPISVLLTVLGPWVGLALFSAGRGEGGALQLGITLSLSAFLILPFSITLLQLRVFYAMEDARTPTILRTIMVLVQAPLAFLCAALLPPEQVVYGLAFVNGLGFVVGVLAGELWLRHRLGRLGSRRVVKTYAKTVFASVGGGAVALAVALVVNWLFPGDATGLAEAWIAVVVAGGLGLVGSFGAMILLRVDELQSAFARIPFLSRFSHAAQ